jgi:hypothetical protein
VQPDPYRFPQQFVIKIEDRAFPAAGLTDHFDRQDLSRDEVEMFRDDIQPNYVETNSV